MEAVSVKGEDIVFSVLLALLLLLVAYPVFLLVLNSFQTSLPWQAPKYGMKLAQGLRRARDDAGDLQYGASLLLAYQAISLGMAIIIAWLIARTDIPLGNLLEAAFWVSFFLPALSTTLGWILLLDPQYGLLNRGLAALPFVQGRPVQYLFSLGHSGGASSGPRRLHQGHVSHADLSQHGRLPGRGRASGRQQPAFDSQTNFHSAHAAGDMVGFFSARSIRWRRLRSSWCSACLFAFTSTRRRSTPCSSGSRRTTVPLPRFPSRSCCSFFR